MIAWTERSSEERGLLSPSFIAMLLWHAARARQQDTDSLLTIEEAFLILPFILHRTTREELPRTLRTSLPVWLNQNPLARGRVATKAALLVPYAKEALLFAGIHRILLFPDGNIKAEESLKATVENVLRETTNEVKNCAKRAEFVAKWFASAGSSATVFALLGVRP